MTIKDADTLKSYFALSKVPSPSQYVDLIDTIFDQGTGGGDHNHDDRYVQLSIANNISAVHTFSPSVYGPPFILGSNAQGQTVLGLKADQLNKSISVSGLGLSGGGLLDANRTITLTSSSNPGLSASILATNTSGILELDTLLIDGKVGIGVSSPATWLDIKGYFGTELIRFSYGATDYHFISASYNGSMPENNYLAFNIEYGSSDIRRVLTMLGNGNVGIGVSTPMRKLDICNGISSFQQNLPSQMWATAIQIPYNSAGSYELENAPARGMRLLGYNEGNGVVGGGISWGMSPTATNDWLSGAWSTAQFLLSYDGNYLFLKGGDEIPNGTPTQFSPDNIIMVYPTKVVEFFGGITVAGVSHFNGLSNTFPGTDSVTYDTYIPYSGDNCIYFRNPMIYVTNGLSADAVYANRVYTDDIIDRAGGNINISPTGDIVLNPTGNDVLPATNYDINLGTINKKYLALHAAELWVETLVAQNTLATIGGRILVGPTDVLAQDFPSGSTTLHSKRNQMSVGDYVYMEVFDGGVAKVEWMKVTDGPTAEFGGYDYTVTRNLDGTGANDWYAGDAVFNTGSVFGGYMDLYSTFSTRSGYGPAIQGIYRYGDAYNYTSEAWAIGNLNGLYGYSSTTMGVGLGLYGWGYAYVTMDNSNGLRMNRLEAGNGNYHQMARWYADGTILIGEVGASLDNILISSGAIDFRVDTTSYINMTTAGAITIGLGSGPNTLIQSTGIQLKNSSTVYIDMTSAGAITVGLVSAGNVYISGSGIALRYGSTTYINLDTSGNALFGRTGGSYANIYWNVSNNRLEFRTDATVKSYIDTDGALVVYTTSDFWARAEAITWNNGSADIATLGAYDSEFLQGVELKTIGVAGKMSSASLKGISLGTSVTTATVSAANDNCTGYMTITAGSTSTSETVHFSVDKMTVGNNTRASELWITGNLTRWLSSGLSYVGYIFVPLLSPLTSTSWDGDLFASGNNTLIDMSAVFGAPAGVKAYLFSITVRDTSATDTNDCYIAFCNSAGGSPYISVRAAAEPSKYLSGTIIVPCNSDGDVYYKVNAGSGSSFMVFMNVSGYYI